MRQDPDLDPDQFEKQDPDAHQGDADPQQWVLLPVIHGFCSISVSTAAELQQQHEDPDRIRARLHHGALPQRPRQEGRENQSRLLIALSRLLKKF